MLPWFFLLFIVIPLTDFMLLVKLSSVVTIPATIAIVILTGTLGAALARHQGLKTLGRIQSELRSGRLPANELGEGMLILAAAALLITPGFITDAAGLLLLIPKMRRVGFALAMRLLKDRIRFQHFEVNARHEARGDNPDIGAPGAFVPPAFGETGLRQRKYVRNEAINGDAASPPGSTD